MNINLDRSYPHLTLRGKATQPLRLTEAKLALKDIVNKSWPHNTLDFYISLDIALGELKKELKEETKRVRESYRNKCQQTSTVKLITLLKDWLRVIKKIEFYHFDSSTKDLFYADDGLLSLYECGNLQTIYLLSEIQKYRAKNVEEESLTLSDLRKDEMEVIYRDVCLKISRHLLTELKGQMYYPSRELVSKLLKFYGFSYNFSKSFEENYQAALLEKKVSNAQESREAIIILFTFKMICGFQALPDVCYYISYLKNVLLDRTNGVLTAEYQTWLLLYEACLKIFARYEVLRQEQAIQIDQILSSNFSDAEFQGFLVKNATNSNVSLSSINFYIKNCRRQEKEELKPHILTKINKLMEENFWKYIEDIFEYVDNELQVQQKGEYIERIKKRIASVVHEQISSQKLYEVEYGLTFILQNLPKHLHEFSEIIPTESLKEIISILRSNPTLEKTTILFRYFDQFINIIYSETSYELMDLPPVSDLLCITKLFGDKNFLCHKSVFKFIYYQLSVEDHSEQTWDSFFSQLAQLYFCGGYDENADLEIIHSHESYRECISTKILQTFQLLICSQITERRELMKCMDLKGSPDIKQSYFMVRSFKDNLLFESIQNICLIFNSHLSMQTLEFGLNYCTPFGFLPPWQPSESEMSLLSLICQEMPIQTLKFIFKEVTDDANFDTHVLESIPPEFWSHYWKVDRQGCALAFAVEEIGMDKIEALQRFRRFEFIMNLACCVFDKLNENSQKNIKEIKIIYEQGAAKVVEIASRLKKAFLEALNLSLLTRIDGLTSEEVRSMDIIEDGSSSFLLANYISKNNFLAVCKEFNLIGKVNQSQKVIEVEQALLPTLKQLKFTLKDRAHDLLYKQIELTLNIEASFLKKIVDNESQGFAFEVQVSKQWARHLLANANALTLLLRKGTSKEEGVGALSGKVGEHLKCLLSKVLLPEVLSLLLRGECKPALSKHLVQLMKGGIEVVHAMDGDHQEHFIVLIERIEEVFREGKEKQVQSQHILSLLQLFFELIFSGIRIRSYHLYRIIKYYQRVTGEVIEQFNSIIAHHIRLLFQEFITNYKPIAAMQQLCSPRRTLSPLYSKLGKQEHSLNYIETACTLSMFINLFCRLNYPSLTLGVEKTFCEEEAKAIYIDYLSSLTRKIVTDHLPIAARDLQILKIDVYGNLNIIAQGRLSERLINKLISLAKNLLRVKTDLRGVNKLPIKILADKIAGEQLEINLEQFEDECKAISLGAISLHKKLAVHITSNLHLCNIYYLAPRNFQKYLELNQTILGQTQKQLAAEVEKVAMGGVAVLSVEVGEEVTTALEVLMRKLEKYYDISQREAEYAEKLYSIFKILCISCLNNPEILPLLFAQRLNIDKTSLSFLDFVLLTLKLALPLFCEFYTTVIKTNCGFLQLNGQVLSKNLEYELTIRQKLLVLLKAEIGKKESSYVFLPKAINYVQQYSEGNRFRFYKFVKNANEAHDAVLREYEKEFNLQLIKTCGEYISRGHSSFTCFQIYELLQASLERAYSHNTALDLKKLMNEEHIKQLYYSHRQQADSNKENLETERRSREKDTANSKQQTDTATYRPLLIQLMQTHTYSRTVGKTSKGRKTKEAKLLRFNCLQEDVICSSDCKGVAGEWSSTLPKEAKSVDVNSIMVEKFLLFNEQIQNREFLKDAIIFPSKCGFELLPSDSLMKGDTINEQPTEGMSGGSIDNIKEENDSFGDFSAKIIEEAQPVYELIEKEEGGSDSIIYSEMEIDNREDGSMKLFGEGECEEDVEEEAQEEPEQLETSKDDILELIQDYTLNPQAIKQIALRIKYLPTGDLHRLAAHQEGEVAYVIQAELSNRGIIPPPQPSPHDCFFVDESKIYERLKGRRTEEKEDVVIPLFSRQFLSQWLGIVLRSAGEERFGSLYKRISIFLRRMLLEPTNIEMLVSETLALITMDNNQFELRFQEVTFNKRFTPEYYKQVLVDQIFGVMVEGRIALPLIFFAGWESSSCSIGRQGENIIELLLLTLIRSSEKESSFLKQLLDYTESLKKVTKYHYPYLDIQDSLTLSRKLIEELSQKMHHTGETFTDNDKHFRIFRLMLFLQAKSYKELLRIELGKSAEAVKRSYQREENVMQIFRKNYSSEDSLEIERKAEIFWQLRKTKNADEHNAELLFCRRMLTDLASLVLQCLKDTCFSLYYKSDQLSMKEELLYLRRQLNEARHYSQRHSLEAELKEKQKRYSFWRRNLINLIVVQEIVPALEEVSSEFLQQVRQTTDLLTYLYAEFHTIIGTTPIIFRQCAEYYKLLLAYELLKKQEEQTYHSMSTLKTIPSIQSGRQFDGTRRRSSLIRNSIFQISCVDTASIVKKAAMMLSLDALALDTASPLFALHARHADMETKLRYLRQPNKLGEKVIEVSRDTLWNDTAPHLDDSFGDYDIKIKIAGELGIDYGGVTREWLGLLVKQILDPRLGLFELNVNGLAFQPSRFSYLVPNHLAMFHKFGILVGKAMKENWLLQINFTKSFLKHMLGALLYVEDLEDLQPDTAKGLLWILKNYVDEDLGLNFTYEEEVLQSKRTVQLVPGGTEVFVNEMNKKQYVKKLAYTKMTQSIREQSLAFISGVEKVVPIHMLRLFNYREMGKYFAGVSTINVQEMLQFAKYEGFSQDCQTIQWFWEVMRSFSEEDKAEFLFFLTGSYRVPYSGFKENPVTINKMAACKDYLPVAHTCFSIIDLPEYSSKDKLERMLTRAVKEGKGFTVS